jgi:hypothetical protein
LAVSELMTDRDGQIQALDECIDFRPRGDPIGYDLRFF